MVAASTVSLGSNQNVKQSENQSVVVNGTELTPEFLTELKKSFSKNIVKVSSKLKSFTENSNVNFYYVLDTLYVQ